MVAWLVALTFTAAASAASIFYVRGGGDGHGIGMSQYGAYGYALHGYDYRSILTHYYQGTELGSTSPGRVVRVLLATGSASFTGATGVGREQLDAGTTYSVRALSNGSLQIAAPSGRPVAGFKSPVTVTGPGTLQVPGVGRYRGSLQFRPDRQGGVETVNAVGLDDYVRGVVAAEMPASWSAQALQAQAVAARTYAITTTVGATGYDLYDDTRSQMYGGVAAETPSTNAAVAATGGQIVTYRGAPAVTYFFASSGGYTENIENVWAGASPEPWLQGVPDPYDGAGGNPDHRWGLQLGLAGAEAKLGALLKGSLIGVQVTRHGASPRILQASVVGTGGATTVTGTELQDAFGLRTTYAVFTTITTVVSAGRLSGSVYPVPVSAAVAVQVRSSRSWQTVAHVPIGADGVYSAPLPGPGRYRVSYARLGGPPVNAR